MGEPARPKRTAPPALSGSGRRPAGPVLRAPRADIHRRSVAVLLVRPPQVDVDVFQGQVDQVGLARRVAAVMTAAPAAGW